MYNNDGTNNASDNIKKIGSTTWETDIISRGTREQGLPAAPAPGASPPAPSQARLVFGRDVSGKTCPPRVFLGKGHKNVESLRKQKGSKETRHLFDYSPWSHPKSQVRYSLHSRQGYLEPPGCGEKMCMRFFSGKSSLFPVGGCLQSPMCFTRRSVEKQPRFSGLAQFRNKQAEKKGCDKQSASVWANRSTLHWAVIEIIRNAPHGAPTESLLCWENPSQKMNCVWKKRWNPLATPR